jgi:hypothetical protein
MTQKGKSTKKRSASVSLLILFLVPPAKVKRRHFKQGCLDENAGFIKPDGLLSVTPSLIIQ